MIQRRSKPLTLLNVFDAPVMETNCTRRGSSTIAPQALQMLNSEFTAQQAEHFAKRVFADKAAADEAGRVTYAFVLAFARPPREGELQAVTEFLKEQTEKYVSESAGPGVGETGRSPTAASAFSFGHGWTCATCC
ncbi:MAG: DUF1553 domain-containing protein [Planctomycetes bacterium]|nr:DUF1553 domain-containing protein [Planctomycetota bacterium]